MALCSKILALYLVHICLLLSLCSALDPFVSYEFEVSYITASPLGVPQQVIAINGKFPGPTINVTTNNNVAINIKNKLDENLLIHWSGIQQRRSSWQDGLPGTNCPIPPKWNWTYQFQVKDQIGSFFYFPSLHMQRASGGFGSFIVNNRAIIPIPFDTPHGDIVILIGDWYKRNHTALRKALDDGKDLGMPDGVLINGKGPYQYNTTLVPDGIDYETIDVQPGKTYRLRVHNVGTSTSLNFRIQNHNLLLAESEGSYTVQQNYTSLDIHVGQSYSFLVTMDQNASTDYYIVASARFVNESQWKRVTGVGILRYTNSKGKAKGPLPDAPNDEFDKTFSMNQARSIRWNVSASGARPNPQGSFRYGSINVTDVYVLKNKPLVTINGKRKATLSGISFVNPATPIRLADQFKVKGVYKLDFPNKPLTGSPKIETSVINGTYRGFMEIILQNNDTKMQSYHLSGYAVFVVGMDYGDWTENSRGTYNKWDGIARSTVQVYPGAWTAILVSLDNVGVWNLRTENLDSWYLGQETYVRIVNPEETNKTELPIPDNALFCGALTKLQKPQDISFAVSITGNRSKLFFTLLMAVCALMSVFAPPPRSSITLYNHQQQQAQDDVVGVAEEATEANMTTTTKTKAQTPLSEIVEAFEELAKSLNSRRNRNSDKGAGGELRLDAFSKTCSLVSVLFSCLGLAFRFAESEYVAKVRDLVEASKEYNTLQTIIDLDVANGTVRTSGSHSRNLRRVRQGLDLIRALFEQFLSTNDYSLREAATTAYSQVCAPYHTWAVRTAVYAGMYTLPTRDQLLLNLNETEHSAKKNMRMYIKASLPVIQYIDRLYISRNISLDW